jgi:hypothetical protein
MQPTTAQSLGSLLKSARDIMRKDKGPNGDLDCLPLLTWIMFLKFLNDLERQRPQESKLVGKKFKPDIEPPYGSCEGSFLFMVPDEIKLPPIPNHGKLGEIISMSGGGRHRFAAPSTEPKRCPRWRSRDEIQSL